MLHLSTLVVLSHCSISKLAIYRFAVCEPFCKVLVLMLHYGAFRECGILPCEEMLLKISTTSVISGNSPPSGKQVRECGARVKYTNIYPLFAMFTHLRATAISRRHASYGNLPFGSNASSEHACRAITLFHLQIGNIPLCGMRTQRLCHRVRFLVRVTKE